MVADGVRVEYGGNEVRVMTGGVKANDRALEVKDGEVEEVVGEVKEKEKEDMVMTTEGRVAMEEDREEAKATLVVEDLILHV